MSTGSNVFISWTRGNPRTRDLGRRLDLDVLYVHRDGNLLARYIKQGLDTWRALCARRPEVIVIMLPPFPLLLLASAYAKLHGCALIADMHTGAFNDPRWKWSLPFTLRLLRGRTAIVTNSFLANVCWAKGIRPIVLHDVIEPRGLGTRVVKSNSVLCPVSYANDEPIAEIIKAADATPEIEWILTGNAPSKTKESAPRNVTFTGFVTDDLFNQLMEQAGVVLALTTRPHTMQRAGYEALSFGVPQVTSDFVVLREFLGGAARYTKLSGTDIARSVRSVIEHREEISIEVARIRSIRMLEQESQLASIAGSVENTAR